MLASYTLGTKVLVGQGLVQPQRLKSLMRPQSIPIPKECLLVVCQHGVCGQMEVPMPATLCY